MEEGLNGSTLLSPSHKEFGVVIITRRIAKAMIWELKKPNVRMQRGNSLQSHCLLSLALNTTLVFRCCPEESSCSVKSVRSGS